MNSLEPKKNEKLEDNIIMDVKNLFKRKKKLMAAQVKVKEFFFLLGTFLYIKKKIVINH